MGSLQERITSTKKAWSLRPPEEAPLLPKLQVFVGYSESSKAYRIYFPGFKNINISKDLTLDEDSAYNKSRKRPIEDSEET